MALDQRQQLLGIEFLHDDDSAAAADGETGRGRGRGMIERRRDQIGEPLREHCHSFHSTEDTGSGS